MERRQTTWWKRDRKIAKEVTGNTGQETGYVVERIQKKELKR